MLRSQQVACRKECQSDDTYSFSARSSRTPRNDQLLAGLHKPLFVEPAEKHLSYTAIYKELQTRPLCLPLAGIVVRNVMDASSLNERLSFLRVVPGRGGMEEDH